MPNRMLKTEIDKYNIFYKAPCFGYEGNSHDCKCDVTHAAIASTCILRDSILYLPNVQRVRLPLVKDKRVLIDYIVGGSLKTLNILPRYLVFIKKSDKVPYKVAYYSAEPKPLDIIEEEDSNECK